MSRLQNWQLAVGLLVLTLAAYLPTWNNGFVDFDDELYITNNPRVSEGLSRSGFVWAWTTFHGTYYQPLSWLSLQFDAHFFSTGPREGRRILSPAAFHGQSLFWHAASTLLLFAVCCRLTRSRNRSFFVAGLFAVHPMHVESVAWAAERKDVLSVFFGILTVWAYLRYLEKPGWKTYGLLGASFFLSLLCKPMLMTLPVVLLLLDYWPLRRLWPTPSPPENTTRPSLASVPFRRLLLEKVPLLVLAGMIAVVTIYGREKNAVAIPFSLLPLSARIGNALTAYGCYVTSTLYPRQLSVLYPHPFLDWSLTSALLGGGLLLFVTVLAIWQARRRPWLIVGWLWFVGTLLPVIGLWQGGEQARADRFTYWPHLGLFFVLVWGVAELVKRLHLSDKIAVAGGALALCVLGGLTWMQIGYWKNPLTLWEHALTVDENNDRAYTQLGYYALDHGQLEEAERDFAESMRLRPAACDYHHFHGVSLLALGRDDEAAVAFEEALALGPKHLDAWQNLGVARLHQGRLEEAERCFRTILSLQSGSSDAHSALGRVLWRSGRRTEAVQEFQTALERNPRDAIAWNGLGVAHLAEGHPDEAIEAFRKSDHFQPNQVNPISNLGVALGRAGRWDEAAVTHRRALEIQKEIDRLRKKGDGRAAATDAVPRDVVLRCRIAFALTQLGDPESGAIHYREATRRDPEWPRKFATEAWTLAVDPTVRDPQTANELIRQALSGSPQPTPALLEVLAATQAALGQFEEAAHTDQEALDKASASGDRTLSENIRNHLQLYRQEKMISTSDHHGSLADFSQGL